MRGFFLFFCSMKILFKWAAICVIPSTVFFLYIFSNTDQNSDQLKAVFFALHFMSAGVAIYLTLIELKRKSIEIVSAVRYIITGVLSAVTHGLIFGLVTGLYFNYFNTDAKQAYIDEVLTPAIVRGFDSTANTKAEYFNHLMEGKDSGVLVPERYAEFRQAAQDSVEKVDEVIGKIVYQNFSISGTIIKWVGFAPIIGILFSVIVTVFVTKK